jgi:DNA (cytosine-5)-methyltransferase 1
LERRTSATGSGLWPTPTVCGNYNRKGASQASGDGLATAVKKWPTPVASEGRLGYQNRNNGKRGTQKSLTSVVQGGPFREVGGSLNPTWVEWLMGWPLGWTDLEPSATGKYLHVLLPRGGF